MKQIISILFVLILNPSFSQDTSTQYKVYQEFLKLPVVIESIINSSTDECGGNYYYSTYDMDTTIKLYFNGNIIIESSLRTGNLHKKSYFEGDFYFLKSSDAVVSVD